MTIFRHIALAGLSSALLLACGSKEKEADVSTPAEDVAVASEDVEEADVDEAATEAGDDAETTAKTAPTALEDARARRAEARRAKVAEAGGSLRDRRAERLAKRGGDTDEVDPKATGPRAIKPGSNFATPKTRPMAMPAVAGAEAVAVKPEGEAEPTGDAVARTADEAVKADAEGTVETPKAETPVDIAPPAANAAQGAPPVPDRVLPITVVAEVLRKNGLRERGALPGIAAVGGYNSIYFDLNAKNYGVALQMWRDASPRETEDRFRRVRLQHPNADDVQAMKPLKAFYAGYFGIQSITFVRPDKQLVVTLSCGEELCDHAALLKLAQAAQGRL